MMVTTMNGGSILVMRRRKDVDTATGFETNETRMRLEGRSKTAIVRPFAVVVIDLGTGSQSGS